jgi:hypothetical protein
MHHESDIWLTEVEIAWNLKNFSEIPAWPCMQEARCAADAHRYFSLAYFQKILS